MHPYVLSGCSIIYDKNAPDNISKIHEIEKKKCTEFNVVYNVLISHGICKFSFFFAINELNCITRVIAINQKPF